jgi:isocitrate lyase
MLLIARTDAESARLISSTVDVTDHEFVRGTTTRGKALVDVVTEAEQRGAGPKELETVESKWIKEHELCTFDEGKYNLSRLIHQLCTI